MHNLMPLCYACNGYVHPFYTFSLAVGVVVVS